MCITFGLDFARLVRKRHGHLGDVWYMDEVVLVMIGRRRQYLWGAVDQDGDVSDMLVQSHKDKQAAKRFFRKLIKGQGGESDEGGATSAEVRDETSVVQDRMNTPCREIAFGNEC